MFSHKEDCRSGKAESHNDQKYTREMGYIRVLNRIISVCVSSASVVSTVWLRFVTCDSMQTLYVIP